MIGETLGNYRIVKKIGEGGMAVVYAAEHFLIGRRAAVKMLKPELSTKSDVADRFFNEARATALVKHPGLLEIFDFGYHENGMAYIVMEFLDGESLSARLKREETLPIDRVVPISLQIAAALGAAHKLNIIHRDLKPGNVFLIPDRAVAGGARVKVIDFGIAKLIESGLTESQQTLSGVLMGSPHYMSPEQCESPKQVDQRSDIYSLGCTMFEMVCGNPPFVLPGAGQIMLAHMMKPPPLLSALAPTVPQALEAIIMRTIAKKPDERFQTMDELIFDLERAFPLSAPGATSPIEIVDPGSGSLTEVRPTPAPGPRDAHIDEDLVTVRSRVASGAPNGAVAAQRSPSRPGNATAISPDELDEELLTTRAPGHPGEDVMPDGITEEQPVLLESDLVHFEDLASSSFGRFRADVTTARAGIVARARATLMRRPRLVLLGASALVFLSVGALAVGRRAGPERVQQPPAPVFAPKQAGGGPAPQVERIQDIDVPSPTRPTFPVAVDPRMRPIDTSDFDEEIVAAPRPKRTKAASSSKRERPRSRPKQRKIENGTLDPFDR